jgi:molybdopterin synthase catalytic subunit/molybdopterin converting factor small subunit
VADAEVVVTVLLFGPLRDRVGVSEMQAGGRTVREVWETVVRQFPAAADAARGLRAARNLDYCDWDAALSSGDTVAFVPPVAGGSGAGSAPDPVRVAITEAPIDAAAVMADVGGDGDGAVAVFVGRVRNNSDGHQVARIDYDVYREMAEREMLQIATSIHARAGITAITIVHRVGTVLVGEASVVIAVAAPHRDAAFAACHDAIEMIKRTVPVWKREHRDDGAHWVDARHGADSGGATR